MKKKFLWWLTKHFKPCIFFTVIKGPRKDQVYCKAYRCRRNRCGTRGCPKFVPTTRNKIARWLGMVR